MFPVNAATLRSLSPTRRSGVPEPGARGPGYCCFWFVRMTFVALSWLCSSHASRRAARQPRPRNRREPDGRRHPQRTSGAARGCSRDAESDADYLAEKICTLRIFEDADGKMNLDVSQTGGAVLAVSQFTLYGDVRRGRRPSFDDAARPERARQLYESFRGTGSQARTALRDRPVSGFDAGRTRQPGPGHHPARLAKAVLGRDSGPHLPAVPETKRLFSWKSFRTTAWRYDRARRSTNDL